MCGFSPTEEALPSDELCVVHLQEGSQIALPSCTLLRQRYRRAHQEVGRLPEGRHQGCLRGQAPQLHSEPLLCSA
ncbi:unnamed protein product [Boreogadus saida]